MKYSIFVLVVGLIGFVSSGVFAADGHIYHMQEVGASDRPLVVAASDRGLVFIGAEHSVYRVFHHEQDAPSGIDQTFLWIENVDSDSGLEFVGAGSPSFVIDDNGDPLWGITEGCHQFFLGNFIDDRRPEVFCRQTRTVLVRSYDGQEYYQWSGRGYNITTCYQNDYDSDGVQEVACDLTSGNHLFFDLDYDEPLERDGSAERPQSASGIDPADGLRIANGEQTLQWGSRQVTLSFNGGGLTISASGSPVASLQIGGNGIYSATTADLNRDGAEELYVGGEDQVFIIGQDGALIATLAANPNNFNRDAQVEIRSATANGLEESDRDVVRAQVEAGISNVTECYQESMGDDPFTRVGTMLWHLTVNGSGRVTDSVRRHSDLRNTDLSSCVENALEDIEFSDATSSSGTVDITLRFNFIDTP